MSNEASYHRARDRLREQADALSNDPWIAVRKADLHLVLYGPTSAIPRWVSGSDEEGSSDA